MSLHLSKCYIVLNQMFVAQLCSSKITKHYSSIPVRSYTFVKIDHEIISTVILFPSAVSFKKGYCQSQAKVCARSTG